MKCKELHEHFQFQLDSNISFHFGPGENFMNGSGAQCFYNFSKPFIEIEFQLFACIGY